MREVKGGDKVRLRYRGTLEDGTEFDSSVKGKPFEVTVGAGRVIPGFEKALLGMKPGETKRVEIEPADAYGVYREDLRIRVGREKTVKNAEYRVGQEVQIRREGERTIIGRVLEVGGDAVLLDVNHPLAGKKLTFEIELVEIV
ncbi:MAG: peptidylprolyl isomerase [Candidatus Latescibacterota bacterium]|nr:MAG: peptidylprolyl isomerase [Candidatus Latescibacterota bacterium]